MLRVDRQDGIATLTLDRPEVGNALDDALVARLGEALAACAADPAVRVVVVTGAGKVFSAGADLNWMRRMRAAGAQANLDDARRTQAVFAAVAELPRPVVARVNGPARGGGVGLLAAADVVVASSEAHFAFSEAKKLVRDVTAADPAAVPALTCELIARLRAGEEGQEGMAAFLEKRPPRWAR